MRIQISLILSFTVILAMSCTKKKDDDDDSASSESTLESNSGKRPADGGEGLPGYNDAKVPVPISGVNLTATYDNAEPICASVISGLKVVAGCYISVEIPSLRLTSSRLPADSVEGITFAWDETLTSKKGTVPGKRTVFAKGLSVTYEVTNSFLTDGGDATELRAKVGIQSTKDTRARSAEVLAPVDPPGAPANIVAASGARSCNLSWGGDALSYVVVRRQGSAVTWVPMDGSSYPVGDLTGGQTVVFSASQISYIDGGLRSGISYDYAVFAKNSAGKYSAASVAACIPKTGGAPLDILCATDASGIGKISTMINGVDTLYLGGTFDALGHCTGGGAPLESDTARLAVAYTKTPRVNGTVHAVISDGSGGWYIGGAFTHVGKAARVNLAHLNADGSVGEWNPGVEGVSAIVYALAKSGTSIYVGGHFTGVQSTARTNVAKVSTGGVGTVDTGWDPGAGGASTYVYALAVANSKVYIGGDFTTAGGRSPQYGFAAVDAATGVLQTTNPFAATATVRAFAVSGNSLYIGGRFTSISGGINNRTSLAAISTVDDSLQAFNPVITLTSAVPEVWAIAFADSKIFIGGTFDGISNGVDVSWVDGFAAVNSSGTGLSGYPRIGYVRAMAAIGSTVYLGGYITNVGASERNGIAAVTTNGALLAWNPEFNKSSALQVWALAAAGNTVFAGGTFRSIGSKTRTGGLGAVDAQGNILPFKAALTSSVGGAVGNVNAMVKVGDTLYVGGSFTNVNTISHNSLMAIDTDGTVHSWDPNVHGTITDMAVSNNVLYVVGNFDVVGGSASRGHGAAYDTSTNGTLLAWDPGANSLIYSLAVGGSVVYLGGTFTSLGGTARSYVGAWSTYSADAGTVQSWNPHASSYVKAVAVSGSTVYMGGQFTSVGATPIARSFVAGVGTDGTLSTTWNPGASNQVLKIVPIGSLLYLGGVFTTVGGTPRNCLATVRTDGSVGSWNPDVTSWAYGALSIVPFGSSIAVGGSWSTIANGYQAAFGVVDP